MSKRHRICPKCGYIYGASKVPSGMAIEKCPKCGAKIGTVKERSPIWRWIYIGCSMIAVITGMIVYLYYTNKNVATELRQIRQPKPNFFFIGIDVSATISVGALEDFKEALMSRLKNFIGDKSVSYHITLFGNPGCGLTSVSDIISIKSPDNPAAFALEVEEKLQNVSVAKVPEDGRFIAPLTTPLYCFFEKILKEHSGARIIIFTDMLNDDSDCRKQFAFPEEAFAKFGENVDGQIIILYPSPDLTDKEDLNRKILKQQEDAIQEVQKMVNNGRVRAYFYHIPDHPEKRKSFMKSQLANSIPATAFDVIWERTTRTVATIVSAVRG